MSTRGSSSTGTGLAEAALKARVTPCLCRKAETPGTGLTGTLYSGRKSDNEPIQSGDNPSSHKIVPSWRLSVLLAGEDSIVKAPLCVVDPVHYVLGVRNFGEIEALPPVFSILVFLFDPDGNDVPMLDQILKELFERRLRLPFLPCHGRAP